jgi:hypothetical protein
VSLQGLIIGASGNSCGESAMALAYQATSSSRMLPLLLTGCTKYVVSLNNLETLYLIVMTDLSEKRVFRGGQQCFLSMCSSFAERVGESGKETTPTSKMR